MQHIIIVQNNPVLGITHRVTRENMIRSDSGYLHHYTLALHNYHNYENYRYDA